MRQQAVPPKKRLFWAFNLSSKYKVTFHARNALTKKGGSTLKFGPTPGPKKISDPHHKDRNFEIVVQSSSYAHSKKIAETNRLEMKLNGLFPILLKIFL